MKRWVIGSLVSLIALLAVGALGLGLLSSSWRREFDGEVQALKNVGAPVQPIDLALPTIPDLENAALPITIGGKFLASLKPDDEPDWDKFLSGSNPDLASLERWVADRKEYYSRMAEAMSLPRCRYPIDYEKGCLTTNPVIPDLLKCGRASGFRAILSLRKGNASGNTDLLAILRLSRSLSGEPLLLSQIIRYVLQELALDLLKSGQMKLSAEEWKAVGESFAAQSFPEDYLHAMEMERATGIQSCVQYFFQGKLLIPESKEVHSWWWMAPFTPKMGTEYVRTLNQIVVLSGQPFHVSKAAEVQLTLQTQGNRDWDRALGLLLIPGYSRAHSSMARAQAAQAAAVSFCRIKAERRTPDTLDVTDPFTGKPMRYEKTAEGFRLWSVGPNLKDDDGQEDDILLESPR